MTTLMPVQIVEAVRKSDGALVRWYRITPKDEPAYLQPIMVVTPDVDVPLDVTVEWNHETFCDPFFTSHATNEDRAAWRAVCDAREAVRRALMNDMTIGERVRIRKDAPVLAEIIEPGYRTIITELRDAQVVGEIIEFSKRHVRVKFPGILRETWFLPDDLVIETPVSIVNERERLTVDVMQTRIDTENGWVFVDVGLDGWRMYTPSEARAVALTLNKAADRVDGVKPAAPRSALQVVPQTTGILEDVYQRIWRNYQDGKLDIDVFYRISDDLLKALQTLNPQAVAATSTCPNCQHFDIEAYAVTPGADPRTYEIACGCPNCGACWMEHIGAMGDRHIGVVTGGGYTSVKDVDAACAAAQVETLKARRDLWKRAARMYRMALAKTVNTFDGVAEGTNYLNEVAIHKSQTAKRVIRRAELLRQAMQDIAEADVADGERLCCERMKNIADDAITVYESSF